MLAATALEYTQAIGIIDGYGAIHFRLLTLGEGGDIQHETLWPGKNRRWRFGISDWNLEKSALSSEGFTEAECEDIIALMRRKISPPMWVIRGEIWESFGRPRDGAKYRAYIRELNKMGIEE